jgi:hypothetical protein
MDRWRERWNLESRRRACRPLSTGRCAGWDCCAGRVSTRCSSGDDVLHKSRRAASSISSTCRNSRRGIDHVTLHAQLVHVRGSRARPRALFRVLPRRHGTHASPPRSVGPAGLAVRGSVGAHALEQTSGRPPPTHAGVPGVDCAETCINCQLPFSSCQLLGAGYDQTFTIQGLTIHGFTVHRFTIR